MTEEQKFIEMIGELLEEAGVTHLFTAQVKDNCYRSLQGTSKELVELVEASMDAVTHMIIGEK